MSAYLGFLILYFVQIFTSELKIKIPLPNDSTVYHIESNIYTLHMLYKLIEEKCIENIQKFQSALEKFLPIAIKI